MKLFLLGAGKPAHGDKPSALKQISTKTKVLDWKINSFSSVVQSKDIYFLGGYHVDEVINDYPELNFTVIADWENKTALHTLLKAPFDDSDIFVSYSDTVYRKKTIENLNLHDADVVFCIDSLWKNRYASRSVQDIEKAETITIDGKIVEFTGLIYFSNKAVKIVEQLIEAEVGKSLVDLIHHLQSKELLVKSYDLQGEWAEFNSSDDIANFILGTKAETLARLEPLVKKSYIGKQVTFTSKEWQTDPSLVLDNIKETFKNKNLVVRSSSKGEDNWDSSNAGGFESILNVDITNDIAITKAINDVISSYGNSSHKDQILVQAFLQQVKSSGVIFTCGLESGSPYYRINFDDTTKSTDSVTAGTHGDLRTIIVSKLDSSYLDKVEPSLCSVLEAVQELEELLNFEKLDIEFAIDKSNKVHIFQVRPIVVNHTEFDIDQEVVRRSINNSKTRFIDQQKKSPFIHGEKTILANMPDWNPAEIIGTRPKPLAFSLYRELITNDIWAKQRFEFGYSDVRPHPLILSMSGQPYVDARASLNSFLPNKLDENLKSKLANAYIDILYKNPHFHDKIEFDIAFTIWTPNFLNKAKERLFSYGITEDEIKTFEEALKDITRDALTRLDKDISTLEIMKTRRDKILESELSSLDKALALLVDTKEYGTLAFSHAARAGFVVTTFLNSFVENGIFTQDRKNEFLMSFQTVAGEFENDKYLHNRGEISLEALIKKYGHLRPGTYELTAQAYWEDPQKYLISENITAPKKETTFTLTSEEHIKIEKMLEELSSTKSVDELLNYFVQATQARELVKFEFTKNLSKALDLIVEFGQAHNISRENMSFFKYNDLMQLKLNAVSLENIKEDIQKREKSYMVTQFIEFPPLIKDSFDFYCFERFSSQPNFVTTKRVLASIHLLKSNSPEDLSEKIVLIPQADPGYDWLFGHKIAGLITQYGGANSHMAIRAAEMGLPAAIGVGEKLYEEISSMKSVELDCSSHIIREVTC